MEIIRLPLLIMENRSFQTKVLIRTISSAEKKKKGEKTKQINKKTPNIYSELKI